MAPLSRDRVISIIRSSLRGEGDTKDGWYLCVCINQLVALKDLLQSYPVDITEYAVENYLADETEFLWWAPHNPKKIHLVISNIKSNY